VIQIKCRVGFIDEFCKKINPMRYLPISAAINLLKRFPGLICGGLCLVLPNVVPVRAQESSAASEVHYGIKAGLNFAELWGEDAIPESDRKVGYSLGAYASLKVSKALKLQPEMIWSLQGEKSEENGRYKISYINVPLMLKWIEGKFYTELGPQLGLLTVNTSKSVPDNLRLENVERFDFSINAGLGYAFQADWSIGIRYCHGVTRLVADRDLRNSVFYLGIAHRLF
jgi:hypothetical protein